MDIHTPLPRSLPKDPEHGRTGGQFPDETSPPYSTLVIAKEVELSGLERDWKRLSEASPWPNVFTTFEWYRAWNRRFAREEQPGCRCPNVLVLKKDGVVVGISPLICRIATRFGWRVRKVEFMGDQADYNDLVLGIDPAGQSRAVVEYLAQTQDHWDLVDLRGLRDAGNSVALIESALSHTGLMYRIVPEEGHCPYLPIDAPSPDIVSRLSRSSRHTLRNQQYRLDRMHTEGLRVRIIENPHEEPGLLEKLTALENQKQVHGKSMPPFLGRYPDVFQSLFDALGPRGWVYVALMELGDQLLAWQLGFRCGKKLWDYTKAYDRTFSRLSPGTMLIPAVLDYGFSHGFEEYDFLCGEEPYKLAWSTGYHERFRLVIRSERWISRARSFVYLDLKEAVYRLWSRAG